MSALDQLLDRARLTTEPYTCEDIAAAERRLAERLVALHDEGTPLVPERPAENDDDALYDAAANLSDLCEAVLRHHTAPATLRRFVTASLPEPSAGRVLGCILNLAAAEDRAMFWWQYAAGGGDETAGYCLYLHHLALGEPRQAQWWLTTATRAACTETSTALRVLRLLKGASTGDRCIPEPIGPLLVYVPTSLTFVDEDVELPLPNDDFYDHIAALTRGTWPPCETPAFDRSA